MTSNKPSTLWSFEALRSKSTAGTRNQYSHPSSQVGWNQQQPGNCTLLRSIAPPSHNTNDWSVFRLGASIRSERSAASHLDSASPLQSTAQKEQQQSTGVRYALLLLLDGTTTTDRNDTTYRRLTRKEQQQQMINLLPRNGSTNQLTNTLPSPGKSSCCSLLGQQQEISIPRIGRCASPGTAT